MAPSVPGPRYAISIRMAGLGDRLICMAGAWLYARATQRTLVVDWRFGYLSPNFRSNGFARFFECTDHLAGVPLIADDSVAQLPWPKLRYPAAWNFEVLRHLPMLLRNRDAGRDTAVRLIRAAQDRPEPVVVFHDCINDAVVAFNDARDFYSALRPVPTVATQVADFHTQQFAGRPVIGLHIRNGNGGDIMGHAPYWDSFDLALQRCLRAVAAARAMLGPQAAVFLSTDSREVQARVAMLLPEVITRPKDYQPRGKGELHLQGGAWRGGGDAVVEMLLLSHCQALIRYPPGSFFSLYAAVMKPRLQPAPRTLCDLLSAFDPACPLSPALIL